MLSKVLNEDSPLNWKQSVVTSRSRLVDDVGGRKRTCKWAFAVWQPCKKDAKCLWSGELNGFLVISYWTLLKIKLSEMVACLTMSATDRDTQFWTCRINYVIEVCLDGKLIIPTANHIFLSIWRCQRACCGCWFVEKMSSKVIYELFSVGVMLSYFLVHAAVTMVQSSWVESLTWHGVHSVTISDGSSNCFGVMSSVGFVSKGCVDAVLQSVVFCITPAGFLAWEMKTGLLTEVDMLLKDSK